MISSVLLAAVICQQPIVKNVDDMSTPEVSECNLHSNSAPMGCICLDEDRVIEVVAEAKACRRRPVADPTMSVIMGGMALLGGLLAVLIQGIL